MINEKKVKLMTKMAMYESKEGQEDLHICEYDRKDYVSLHTLISLIWATVGFVLIAGIAGINMIDSIMEKLTKAFMVGLVGLAVGGWLIILVVFGLIAVYHYGKRYDYARRRVKWYNRSLSRLRKIQDRENVK